MRSHNSTSSTQKSDPGVMIENFSILTEDSVQHAGAAEIENDSWRDNTVNGPTQSEKQSFFAWRKKIFASIFVGYSVFYFCRKNFSAAVPGLIADLGLTKTEIGTLSSLLYLSYGVSKFANGLIADRLNARYFMSLGLALSALSTIAFGSVSSGLALGVCWALNGWTQGMGWPPCSKLLTHWFAHRQIGKVWGIFNASHQIGVAIILPISGYLVVHYSWRASFWVPGAIALAYSLVLLIFLRDSPESLGLPTIEQMEGEVVQSNHNEPEKSQSQLLKKLYQDPALWMISIANFFVYLVRYGTMDWAPTFLVEQKGFSLINATFFTALLEIAGIAGAFGAGWISDQYFSKNRSVVNVFCMLFLTIALLGLWWVPPGFSQWDAVCLGFIGFMIYGPQLLVGVCAAEIAGKRLSAAATGLTGLLGYIGSMVSGIGGGLMVDHFGWGGGFMFFIFSSLLGALFFFLANKVSISRQKALAEKG